jgi:hypothetical protein
MKKSRLLGLVLAVFLVAVLERAATALEIDAPWGTASTNRVRGVIGTDGSNNVWVDWQKRATGECTFTFLGNVGSLTSVGIGIGLTFGNDIFEYAPPGGLDICGFGPLFQWNSEETSILVWGDTGNDVIDSHHRIGPGSSGGGEGNDWIFEEDWSSGGEGADILIMQSNFFTTIDGGPGNDCLAMSMSKPLCSTSFNGQWNGGDGTDAYAPDEPNAFGKCHHPANMINMEVEMFQPFWFCNASTITRPAN